MLTYIGLRHGYLVELNPLMSYVLESGYIELILLSLFLTLCFAVLYRCVHTVSWLGSVIFAVLVIKAAVLAQHLAIIFNVLLYY